MNREDIIRMAREAGFFIQQNEIYSMSTQSDQELTEWIERFAALVASAERERIYAEQLELPKPRLTGKFSITAGKFKCTGCTGTWTDREDAQHHSCKDYQ
jgi:hypothetical protein